MNTTRFSFAQRIDRLTGSVAREILSRIQDGKTVSFAGGLPDAELWKGRQLPRVKESAYQYGPSEGEINLRSRFSRLLSDAGLKVMPEEILVTSGSQQGIDLASKLFIDPGTRVAIESTTYLAALQVFRLFGADTLSLKLGPDGIDPMELDELLSKYKPAMLYLNPTFQNPTGVCYPLSRRRELAEVIDRHNTVLLEDDPYRQLNYDRSPAPPICSFLKSAPWIYLGTVSKILMPGLRIGFLATIPELYPHLVKLKQASDLHTSRITQSMACSMLFDNDSLRLRINQARNHYHRKRDAMQEVLEQYASDLAEWEKPQGGMFFWLKLKQPVDMTKLLNITMSQGIAFMPGDTFQNDPRDHGRYMRLNFSHPTFKQIETTLPRLFKILADVTERNNMRSDETLAQALLAS